jgi:hypothetical protein
MNVIVKAVGTTYIEDEPSKTGYFADAHNDLEPFIKAHNGL